MKLNKKAFAGAAAALGAAYYLACYVIVLVAPDVYRDVAQSWAHGVNISAIWRPMTGNFLTGIVSFTGTSWISGWLLAFLYNRMVK